MNLGKLFAAIAAVIHLTLSLFKEDKDEQQQNILFVTFYVVMLYKV